MNFSQTSATSWRRSLFILQCNLKRSSNMVDLHDYDIELIEREILWKYNDNRRDYSDCDCLLSLRKSMINKRVLAHQEDILPDIIVFNDALRDALKDMYDRAYSIWDSIKENAWGDDMEVTAKCFLSYDYPELHPLQGEEREELWGAICDSGWNPLYDDGVTLPTLTLPRDINEDFDTFIGMDCPPSNWNEGLDRELTKDLHLISAFHNLFDHMKFAITDFIYVRKFETEINIEINKNI